MAERVVDAISEIALPGRDEQPQKPQMAVHAAVRGCITRRPWPPNLVTGDG